MIIDTSALISVLEEEVDAARIGELLGFYGGQVSAGTLLEARIVTQRRRGSAGLRRLEELLRRSRIEVVAFDIEQADIASDAYRDFGKGSGHPAGLNFGDCFSYALANERDEPLLYVGDDFARTDIRSALEEYADE